MKFLTLPILSLLAAIPLISADGAAIQAATEEVTRSALAFNTTVASFDGDLLTVLKILGQSTDLLVDIKRGTATAKKSANLTDAEALALAGPTQNLVTTVQSTLTTVVGKKAVFQRTLTQAVALINLKAEKSASEDFGKAVVAKIPPGLQPIAQNLIAPLTPAFDAAIKEFEDFF
ncbi:putative hydrophobic surface-binding protein A [Elsinoe fawcettii]|nr:putative hydrophobic surface-binding protein A [Elsinoe fawcettii]